MEELVNEKEKELERVEEQGCALVQNKTDEACAIVMETLQGVNHTWANLDHLVSSLVLFPPSVFNVILLLHPSILLCSSLFCSFLAWFLQFTECHFIF